MKFLKRYLREHLRLLVTFVSFAVIFAIAFLMYHLPIAAVLYPTLICVLIGLIVFGISAYQAYRKHIGWVRSKSCPPYP